MYLEVNLPALSNTGPKTVCWAHEIGHVLIKSVKLIVGSQTIDTHYGEWLSVWNSLTRTASQVDTYNAMIGNVVDLTDADTTIAAYKLNVPMQFWFNRYVGSALPLIAQAYADTKLEFEFRSASECYITSDALTPDSGVPVLGQTSLWVDYVFLSEEERVTFAQKPYQYLMEELQYHDETIGSANARLQLDINQPVRSMYFVLRLTDNVASGKNRWMDFTDSGTGGTAYAGADPLTSAKLLINGGERFSERTYQFFNQIQPLQHHTSGAPIGVYMYSFCLEPERFQPTGSLNFSRIDKTTLQVVTTTGSDTVQFMGFFVSQNIYRVIGGQANKLFSS